MASDDSRQDDNVKVCVRIRPLIRDEFFVGCEPPWTWDRNAIVLDKEKLHSMRKGDYGSHAPPTYCFDHLFKPEDNNGAIFHSVVKNLASKCMEGFHGSVFTYGQTSSGKTYTMNGSSEDVGIIYQCIHHCFDSIQLFPGREFLFRVSYLEVYNEQVNDLLSSEPSIVKIQHGAKVGTVLSGVKEQVVQNPEQVINLIRSGEIRRHIGSTDMNEKSSRAHTLFKMIIESRDCNNNNGAATKNHTVRVSTLSLVDLAGSENAKMTNSTGERAKEAKHINQSLLTLSTIIQRLSEEKNGQNLQHLPYRDSKLTRLMQASLSGNANIAVICTISPTLKCVEESNNTLRFAARAKRVRSDARINEILDDKTLIRVYRMEIEQLRARLRELEQQASIRSNSTSSSTATALIPVSGSPTETSDSSSETARSRVVIPPQGDDDAENMDFLLQMITEMERLILRADPNKTSPGKSSKPSTPTAKALQNSSLLSTEDEPILEYPSSNVVGSQAAATTATNYLKDNLSTNLSGNAISSSSLQQTPAPAPGLSPSSSTPKSLGRSQLPVRANKSGVRQTPQKGATDINRIQGNMKSSGNDGKEKSRRPSVASVDTTSSCDVDAVDGSETRLSFDESMEPSFVSVLSECRLSFADEAALVPREGPSSKLAKCPSGLSVKEDMVNTVNRLLSMLKQQLSRTAGRRPLSSAEVARLVHSSQTMCAQSHNEVESSGDETNASAAKEEGDEVFHASINQLKRELRLKEADNRFLQEELDRKEQTLSLLTEGLREVEVNQNRWIVENDLLCRDLDNALLENEMLKSELKIQGKGHLLVCACERLYPL